MTAEATTAALEKLSLVQLHDMTQSLLQDIAVLKCARPQDPLCDVIEKLIAIMNVMILHDIP